MDRLFVRRILGIIFGVIIILALAVVIRLALHTHSNTVYTWQKPASHIVFNQITNNPAVGDERAFLTIRDLGQSNYSKAIQVHDGQELVLQVYYDNNAGHNLNRVAVNTKVRLSLPSGQAKDQKITALISADNAHPRVAQSIVTASSGSIFRLNYEQGSARIWNNALRGKQLSDSIVTKGALIGYKKLDGRVPGGFKYSGYVTLKVRVKMPQSTKSPVTTPGSVANTGPGSVVGLFLAASAIGTLAHILYTRLKAPDL